MNQRLHTAARPSRREFLGAIAFGAPALATARSRPNILLLSPDQQRFDWTGLNSRLPLRTPNFNALARRGAVFNHAIVTSPLCAPSRACLAAGKEYHRCGVPNNTFDYPLDQRTYYSMLRDSGYHVAGCGKLDLHKASFIWGLDGKTRLKEWGFSDGIDNAGKLDAVMSGAVAPKDPYMAYLHRRGLAGIHVADFKKRSGPAHYSCTAPTPLPEDAYCDNWVASNGLKLMRSFPKGKPWHLVVNFTGPHSPMDITGRMERICRNRDFPQPAGSTEFTPEIHVAIRQNYAAMIENIDRWIGIYLEEIEKRGELENTIIVYTSDHGEMLGDQNRWAKSVPWQPSVGVPLMIAGPGIDAGIRSNALVSHMDLTATFLDCAGLPVPRDMDSRSLRPLLTGKARAHREYVRSGLNSWRLVFDGRYKLIRGFDPMARGRQRAEAASGSASDILFDLRNDPFETRNVASDAPGEVERLAKLLA